MTNTQLILVRIDNYGPWTVTPDPRREMDFQTLQSRPFADLAQCVGSRDEYAFFIRFDSMIVATNGLSRDDHKLLQGPIANRYPVTPSLGINADRSSVVALEHATDHTQRAGSTQDGDRREVLSEEALADADRTGTDLQVAYFDVNDATGRYTDRLNELDMFIHIEQGYASFIHHLREERGALSFFAGGDNIISITPSLTEDQYRGAIDHVEAEADMEPKVSVGTTSNAHEVGFVAKHAFEDRRHRGTIVEYANAAVETADD